MAGGPMPADSQSAPDACASPRGRARPSRGGARTAGPAPPRSPRGSLAAGRESRLLSPVLLPSVLSSQVRSAGGIPSLTLNFSFCEGTGIAADTGRGPEIRIAHSSAPLTPHRRPTLGLASVTSLRKLSPTTAPLSLLSLLCFLNTSTCHAKIAQVLKERIICVSDL